MTTRVPSLPSSIAWRGGVSGNVRCPGCQGETSQISQMSGREEKREEGLGWPRRTISIILWVAMNGQWRDPCVPLRVGMRPKRHTLTSFLDTSLPIGLPSIWRGKGRRARRESKTGQDRHHNSFQDLGWGNWESGRAGQHRGLV